MEKFYIKTSKWQDYKYELNYQFITKDLIYKALDSFWGDVVDKETNFLTIQIQFKVMLEEDLIRSMSYIQTVGKNEKNILFDIFNTFWDYRHEEYHMSSLLSIVFTYRFILPVEGVNTTNLSKPLSFAHLNTEGLNKDRYLLGFNLPSTMDLTLWGDATFSDDFKFAKVFDYKTNRELEIKLYDNYQIVNVKIHSRTIFSFRDEMKEKNNLDSFTRKLSGYTFDFLDRQLVLKQHDCKVSFMGTVSPHALRSDNFITLDLETRTINGKMKPYCVSIYNGKFAVSFYLADFKNEDEMLKASIRHLMVRKYDNYRIYVHNFSYFDSIFLIKTLSELTENIKPIIRDGRIIDLRFKFKIGNSLSKRFYTLYFRDSYLILTSSLDKLAKQFKVENKTIFPYFFVNDENIPLNYVGSVPNLHYFKNLNKIEYDRYVQSYLDSGWDLKKETISYCEQDVRSLYQVLNKFSERIFKLFRLNIHNYPTLPSLSLAIFRSNFLGNLNQNIIPLISGKIYKDLKQGYTGGSVDSFVPLGSKIYHYDVNSLYPYVMKEHRMPIGSPIYFEGDITVTNPHAFGVFEVEVEAPKDLKIPILQTKIRTENGGFRTVSPLGKWTDVYFSEEIYNAQKYGYRFKIIRGYLFEKGDIFKDYVGQLYSLKQKSTKDSPDYAISKLILNSISGKFGMSPEDINHIILSNNLAYEIYAKNTVIDSIDLKNGKELISYIVKNKKSVNKNISVPIAIAITACARMHMAKLKMELTKLGYIIYYSDTDSLFLNKPLEAKHVGTELGQMKLENIFKEAVFLCPKVYGGITEDNEEVVKIKGAKNPITFAELKTLLKKDTKLEIKQDKWYRNISDSTIAVKDEIYSLIATENKRILIYDDNNNLIDTKPLNLPYYKNTNNNKKL